MSSYTAQAFVAHGAFGPETRKHQALRFLEELTNDFFDARDHSDVHEWFAEEFSYVHVDGDHKESSREDAFGHASDFYLSKMTAHRHIPYSLAVVDAENGWTIYSQCKVYANLVGTPAAGEKKERDPDGNEWDILTPGFYHFDLIKNANAKHHGILVQHTKMIFDSGMVISTLEKRGVKLD